MNSASVGASHNLARKIDNDLRRSRTKLRIMALNWDYGVERITEWSG
jgi:hypothetical protein